MRICKSFYYWLNIRLIIWWRIVYEIFQMLMNFRILYEMQLRKCVAKMFCEKNSPQIGSFKTDWTHFANKNKENVKMDIFFLKWCDCWGVCLLNSFIEACLLSLIEIIINHVEFAIASWQIKTNYRINKKRQQTSTSSSSYFSWKCMFKWNCAHTQWKE